MCRGVKPSDVGFRPPRFQKKSEVTTEAKTKETTMNQAFICDAIRTPFGRYGGALSSVRTDDLAAVPLKA